MSYATDPAYLKLVEESRAYRAQPNVKAANNAARAREGMFRKNFFNRTGRYPTVNELINMGVQAEMANLVGVRQELNPNVAAVLGNQNVHEHNYNANIAKWKAGVANRSINVRARPRQNVFSQKVNLNNRAHEPKSWAVNAQKEAEASNWLQSRAKALGRERVFPVLPVYDFPKKKVNQIVIPASLRPPSRRNEVWTPEELDWEASYPARKGQYKQGKNKTSVNNTTAMGKMLSALRGQHGPAHSSRKTRKNRR
jgi:hypothetical protein